MSNVSQYAQNLHQEILVKCADGATPEEKEDAFVEFVTEELSDHNEVDIPEIIRPATTWKSTKGSNPQPAAKINAWSLSGDGSMLDLYIASYRAEENRYEISKSEAHRQFELVKGFLVRSFQKETLPVAEENEAFNAIRRIRDSINEIAKVRLILITNGIVKGTISELKPFDLDGKLISYVLWDLAKLSQLKPGEQSTIDLDFLNLHGNPLGCITSNNSSLEYRTFLAFMPAPLLAKIYGEYGQRLLERNVRAFLQATGSVNGGIQKTLKKEPDRFLAYNNGLCCTASNISVDLKENGLGLIKEVSDFQIVNGGQTTASIFHAIKNKIDVSNVMVQMKLTVVSSNDVIEEIVPLISKYANSQNKVASADFAANGPFHRHLEQVSRNTWAPGKSDLESGSHWYYERARGSYQVDRSKAPTIARRREFELQNPREQKFTKTDLAKFEHSWMGYPHIVCQGAQKNFAVYTERIDDFGHPNVTPEYFHHLIGRAILFKRAERIVTGLQLGGYRANIVAYTIAWLAYKSDFKIDLELIWKRQAISAELVEVIEVVAKAVHNYFEEITSTGPWKANLGENTKKEECWNQFRNRQLDVPNAWQLKLSSRQFLSLDTSNDTLPESWDLARDPFINSNLTVKALEGMVGETWPSKGFTSIADFARLSYFELTNTKRANRTKIREMIRLLEAARISIND
jgi:hypothetical protein